MIPKVHVIATTLEGTRAALTTAVPLARGLDAVLAIVVPNVVSCSAELNLPAPATELIARRYVDVAHSIGADAEVEIVSCVGLEALVARLCAAHAPIVVGGPVGRWLTSPEERFANRLALAGCQVIFVASGANTTQRRVAA